MSVEFPQGGSWFRSAEGGYPVDFLATMSGTYAFHVAHKNNLVHDKTGTYKVELIESPRPYQETPDTIETTAR
jgi:hypothetical protein